MYDFKFHPEAEKELTKLNKSVQTLFPQALKKTLKSPELGVNLRHKHNFDLSGYLSNCYW